jgi:microcystin-dependent protein
MTSPYIGEIRLFGGSFAPQNWAFCNGALLPVQNFEPLFTLIGTTYGGDGVNNFALPNLCSRVPVHQGAGGYVMGMTGGQETVTLTDATMPVHNHPLYSAAGGQVQSPDGALLTTTASTQDGTLIYGTGSSNLTSLTSPTIQMSGGSQPHDNIQPYLALNFIIALYGIWPPQG